MKGMTRQEIADKLLDKGTLVDLLQDLIADILESTVDESDPGDLFTAEELGDWAEANGYVPGNELEDWAFCWAEENGYTKAE